MFYIEFCECVCQEVFDLMLEYVFQMGVNVVVVMCYDVNDVVVGVIEVFVYGIVVVIELMKFQFEFLVFVVCVGLYFW